VEWVAVSGKSLTTIYATHDEILSFEVDGVAFERLGDHHAVWDQTDAPAEDIGAFADTLTL